MAEVFINYRGMDGGVYADLIAGDFAQRFGAEHVFKASRSIRAGSEYRDALIGAVRACEVLLVLIGPDWAQSERLHDPEDWVRKEILEAFATNKNVVPVLTGRRTEQPQAADLPQELVKVAYLQSRRIDHHNSEADLEQIAKVVTDYVPHLKAADGPERKHTNPEISSYAANDNSGTVIQGSSAGRDMNVSRDTYFLGEPGKPRLPLQQPSDLLKRLESRFVQPDSFDTALATLQESGTVIIDGPRGSGRTAAAKMLLLKSSSEASRVHDISPVDPDERTSFRLDQSVVERNDRVWVDLTHIPDRWDVFQEDLPSLYARVRACDARLVVIQPTEAQLHSEFRDLQVTIAARPALIVYQTLLRKQGLLADEGSVSLPRSLANRHGMGDIQQFIDHVLQAKQQAGDTGTLDKWIEAAEERASPREQTVASQLELVELSTAPQRALLLCTAMLHGAHADVIDQAATDLLVRLGDEAKALLLRPPLRERLSNIGVKADDMRCVRFSQPGYEFAVRAFFWRHFPELHDILADWVCDTIDSKELNPEEQADLARAFVDVCLEERYQHFWVNLVARLTTARARPFRLPAAAAILEHGLSDQASSGPFRRQIYNWSTARDTSANLATVVAAACVEMSETHPDQAVVRLHHLSRNHPERSDVRETLAGIAASDPWLLSFYLDRLAHIGSEAIKGIDAGLFLELAGNVLFTTSWPATRLLAQQQVTSGLTACWGLVFDRLPAQAWAPEARNWLRTAAEDGASQSALLDVLVGGARRRPSVLSTLFALAHRSPFRDVLSGLLLNKISNVQGVDLS